MVAKQPQDNQLIKTTSSLSIASVLFALLVVILLFSVSQFSLTVLPIRQILLEGKFQYSDPHQLQHVLDQSAKSGLFALDLREIKTELLQFPWIKSVEIERIWPDRLRVYITEKNPYLRLGDDKIVSVDGTAFSPGSTQKFSDLPLFDLHNRQFTPELFKAYREIEYLLAQNGYELRQFHINEQGIWSLDLANDIRITIGRHNPLTVFKRFVVIWPNIGYERINTLKSVDLRYENGFALEYTEHGNQRK
ncbi:MAG TPA: FtsQ-type POTRA domain-containing protein [Crenotrichaceae bacterium]|nr:FtsQ-type POTRA domain-containing protein [Crenotrichaceae bacterium]